MKSNWGKVGHLFSHAAIICRLSIFIPVGLFLRVTWFIWPTYRLVVGQKRLRSRLEFYFDGNFLGGRAALEAESLLNGRVNQQRWRTTAFVIVILKFWTLMFESVHWMIYALCNKNKYDVTFDRHIFGRHHCYLFILVC